MENFYDGSIGKKNFFELSLLTKKYFEDISEYYIYIYYLKKGIYLNFKLYL